MWESLKTRATDFTAGGRFKRRGAKLGILIAIMMTLPGLVAATAYVSGSNTGTLTSATTNTASANCGWWKDTNLDAEVAATAITTTFTSGGSAVPTAGTVTVTANAVEVGSTGYEYLVDELVFGCLSTPAAPATTSITVTVGSATVTGASVAVIQLTSSEPDAAVNPTATGGAACDTGVTPNLWNPAATATTNIAASGAYVWDAVSHATISGCGTLSLSFSPAAGITTDTSILFVSYAITGESTSGLSASAAFTMGFTATVTG